jgi:hypothetical protein
MSETNPGHHGIQPGHDVHGVHHGPTFAGPRPVFTDEEWEGFQKADRTGGGVVVGLMTAIFTIGLILYTTIALVV